MFVSAEIGNESPPPADVIEAIDGFTYVPSGALMSAIPRFAVTAKSYERYATDPSVWPTAAATPSFPFEPFPVGHCTALPEPIWDSQSVLTLESQPVNTAVVPDSSAR